MEGGASALPVEQKGAVGSSAPAQDNKGVMQDNSSGGWDPQSNLIVNYLPPIMQEPAFREMFEKFGELANVKIVRDRATQQSLGYGFVRFTEAKNAQEALKAINGLRIGSKTLKVSVARPQNEHSKNTNLYVCGLPTEFVKADLEKLFSTYGTIVECRVLMDQRNQCRGVGFVRLETHANAQKALAALNGITCPGALRPLQVKFAQPPHNKRGGHGAGVHGGGIGGYGGYGHMGMMDQQMQLQQMHGMRMGYGGMGGQQMQGGYGSHMGMGGRQQGGQGYQLSEQDMYQLFSQCGQIASVKVMKDMKTGRSKGFGFVNMMTMEQANFAIKHMNGYQIGNKFLKVSIKTSKGGQAGMHQGGGNRNHQGTQGMNNLGHFQQQGNGHQGYAMQGQGAGHYGNPVQVGTHQYSGNTQGMQQNYVGMQQNYGQF